MTTIVPEGGFPRIGAAFVPLPLGEVYATIEPGPVVFLTTAHQGRANVMTMSWHTMVEFTPPTIACVVSSADFSSHFLTRSRECVIAIPSVADARRVVAVGNSSGRDTDKFAAFGLTPLAGSRVAAPLVAECFVCVECRVVDTTLVESRDLWILEGVAAWIDPTRREAKTIHHRGHGSFAVDGRILKLPSKMP